MRAQPSRIVGRAMVKAPGTCGELVQGFLDGSHFLVTCPVDLYSTVSVVLYRGQPGVLGPEDCPKAIQAVCSTLAYLGKGDLTAELTIHSPLPRGKGMASSTADVAGAAAATALALGIDLTPRELGALAVAVEPSDGVMFPGIALFDHRQGEVYEGLGLPPAMEVIVLDFGGVVDTLEFNRVDRQQALASLEPQFREALGLVCRGIASGSPSLIGQGATLSALAHQAVLPKAQLSTVMELARSLGALGVNAAHSGTVVGLLLDPRSTPAREVLPRVLKVLPSLESAFCLHLIGGGIQMG